MKCIFVFIFSLIFFAFFNIFSKYNDQIISLNCIFSTIKCSLSTLIELLTLTGFIFGLIIFSIIYIRLYFLFYKLKQKFRVSENERKILKILLDDLKKKDPNTK